MTLKEYIKSGTTDITTMAYTLGVSEGAVHKWVYEQRRPNLETALKIVQITKGAVGLKSLIGAGAVKTLNQAITQGALDAPKGKRAKAAAA